LIVYASGEQLGLGDCKALDCENLTLSGTSDHKGNKNGKCTVVGGRGGLEKSVLLTNDVFLLSRYRPYAVWIRKTN